jgi:hypothetical protein
MFLLANVYDLDPEVIAAALSECPERFTAAELARHPRMLAAHKHMVGALYDRLVATFLTAYMPERGLVLVEGGPFDAESTWRKLPDAPPVTPTELYRYQRRSPGVGVRVFCPAAGLTGTIIDLQKPMATVRYDLGTVRHEDLHDLRAALPGETTGTRGLPPSDPFFAEQQAQLSWSRAYLESRQSAMDP